MANNSISPTKTEAQLHSPNIQLQHNVNLAKLTQMAQAEMGLHGEAKICGASSNTLSG